MLYDSVNFKTLLFKYIFYGIFSCCRNMDGYLQGSSASMANINEIVRIINNDEGGHKSEPLFLIDIQNSYRHNGIYVENLS